ncbi:MAG: hypothetical protein QOE86_144, partial [Solirubrobacteraceae bacterium]|nr:hypothetical protein [Solirubrobacteraceae bacterium]
GGTLRELGVLTRHVAVADPQLHRKWAFRDSPTG